jgi:HAD superfamily hydrolase (TIGR01509 family)
MELAALMLDVDGTIAESEDAHREAFNVAFKEFGVAWHWDKAIYRDLLGVSGGRERIRHYINRTHPEMASRPDLYSFIEAMHQSKSQAYAELVAEKVVGMRPGVIRLLSEARERGLRLALVTSTTEENLRTLFDKALGNDVFSWFEVIGDGSKVPAKKPAPDIYSWALQELGLPAALCLAIEDSPKGLRAALAAGVAAIVTVSSYTEGEDFTGATAVLSGLGEPDMPFELVSGDSHGGRYVTVDLLKQWLDEAHAARPSA